MRPTIKRLIIALFYLISNQFGITAAQNSPVQVEIMGSVTWQPADLTILAYIDGNTAVNCTIHISGGQICSLPITAGYHDVLFEMRGAGVKTLHRNFFRIRPDRDPKIDLGQIIFERSNLPVVSRVLGERNQYGNLQVHFTLHNPSKQSLLVADIQVHAFTPSRIHCYEGGFRYLYRIAGNLRAYASATGLEDVHTKLENLTTHTTVSVNGQYISTSCQTNDRELTLHMPVSIPLTSDEYQEVIVEMPEHFDLVGADLDTHNKPAKAGVLVPEKQTQSFDFDAYEFRFTTDDGKTFDAAYNKRGGDHDGS